MSFFKSFFGAMAANEINEKKKEANERLNNSRKIIELSLRFYEYLKQIGCKNVSFKEIVSDYDIDNNNVSSYDVIRTDELYKGYKRQLKEFMSYGGNPVYICDSECDSKKMDLYIEIVKRLKEYGWLDKQDKYIKYAEDTFSLDFDWEHAQKDNHKLKVQIPALLNAPDNELTEVIKCSDDRFIPYDEHKNAIVIDMAKSNDETIESFLEFLTISLVFSDDYILIYNDEHNEIYYKANVKWKDVEVDWTGITVWNWSLVKINGLPLLFNTEKAKEVVSFYGSHNVRVAKAFRDQFNTTYENINSLSGVEFEMVCKRLLENMGFEVETTKTTGDGGIDLIAYNHQPLLSGKYIIQCKRYTGSVGEPTIRDLYGVITSERANKGILMTSGTFTKQAQIFAQEKPIELIDGIKLQELLENFYYL